MSSRIVPHIVVGNTIATGGQWVDNPVKASWDIGTLSYANMLSLPGYSFAEHYQNLYGKHLPSYLRPTRREVAAYFATYPSKTGINDVIYNNLVVQNISRLPWGGFQMSIGNRNIRCQHLVLSSGIFTNLIPPRPLLQPLLSLPSQADSPDPILVIGSGFSAADVIISTPPSQKILHIYKFAPNTSPSPLKACHQQAYPEYAGVYRRMKLGALKLKRVQEPVLRPHNRRRSSAFELERDWDEQYEGCPNTAIVGVRQEGDGAIVTLQRGSEPSFERRVSGFAYVVGRRGNLDYLSSSLRAEVLGSSDPVMLSGQSLRGKAAEDLEVAPCIFITGSLTGDSLIRFAYGSCVYTAGKIMQRQGQAGSSGHTSNTSSPSSTCSCSCEERAKKHLSTTNAMHGLDGHNKGALAPKAILEDEEDLRDFDEPLSKRNTNSGSSTGG